MFLTRGTASVLSPDSIAITDGFYDAVASTYFKLPGGGGRLSLIGGVMVAVFILGALLAHRTRFGSYVDALGGNSTSAALMGVPVARTTVLIYTLASTLAGLAGIVFSLYTSAGYSLAAVGVELDAIGAFVIGGPLLTGGYGFVAGTFIGVMLMGLVQTYIIFDGTLSSWWAKTVIGVLLFMFILLQRPVFRASAMRKYGRRKKMNEPGPLIRSLSGRQSARNFHSFVINEIGLGVASGAFPLGSILPNDAEMMDRYGVSRTVLREALKTLEAKGLVEARAKVGTRIQPRSRWNLFDRQVLFWIFHAATGWRGARPNLRRGNPVFILNLSG